MNGLKILSSKKQLDAGGRLIGVVAPDRALAGARIVRAADAREQQHAHIVEREGADQNDLRRLLPFRARAVHIGHAGGALARGVEIDLQHFAFGPRLEIRFAHQHRQHRGLRAGLRIVGAAEPLAEAAIGALPHIDAERVGIGARQVRRRLRERMIAERARRFREQRSARRSSASAAADSRACAALRTDCRRPG